MARVAEHPDGDDPAHALPGALGALHCHGQGRPGKKGGGGINSGSVRRKNGSLRFICVP